MNKAWPPYFLFSVLTFIGKNNFFKMFLTESWMEKACGITVLQLRNLEFWCLYPVAKNSIPVLTICVYTSSCMADTISGKAREEHT